MKERLLLVVFIFSVLFVLFIAINLSTYSPGIVKKDRLLENRFTEQEEETEAEPIHWSSELSPNGLYRGDSFTYDYRDRYNYYQIFVTELMNNKMWRIYSGDFRSSGWEWIGNNKIKIIYNCGTGCQATKVIGVNETFTISDKKDGLITEENGWKIEFFKSF